MPSYSEQLLLNVVHDVRQPLSTIESSAYYLNVLLGDTDPRAAEQVRMIQRQVSDAARILSQAAAELGRLRAQRTVVENLDLTKPETAAVT
jgi:signal transduction histidine kinase